MAGVNPATGQFDPYYVSGSGDSVSSLATSAPPSGGAAQRTNMTRVEPGATWVMPVVGLRNSPSKFQAGGPAAWAKGSFGYQKPASKGGHVHKGVDIYADTGAAIVAPVTGTIKAVGSGRVSGNYVKVIGDDGYEYYFAHMDNVHTGLSNGMRINQGQYLGGVGATGNASGTQAHLHFEIRKNGKSINPNGFLESGKVQDTTSMSAIPGLSSPEQIQAYMDEYQRASQFMAAQGQPGFDAAGWGAQSMEQTEDDRQRAQIAQGQSVLGATLNGMSQSLAGGNRTMMPRMSTAMTGSGDAPSAADQRQRVEEV